MGSRLEFSEFMYCSTAVREFPIKRGVKSENIRATTVIKKPRSSFVRYLQKYLLRYCNAFIARPKVRKCLCKSQKTFCQFVLSIDFIDLILQFKSSLTC